MKIQDKSEQIYSYIGSLIENEIELGGKFPTEMQMADMLKVNRMTVAKVMSVFKKDGIIERRQGIGTVLIKRPAKPNGIITVVPVKDVNLEKDEYFSTLVNSISIECMERKITNTFVGIKDRVIGKSAYDSIMTNYNKAAHAGIVMIYPTFESIDYWLKEARAFTDKTVWVGVSGVPAKNAVSVDTDNRKAMLDLFDYMVAAGFRKIGLISFPLNSTDNIDRYKAFAEAHRRNNIALDKNRIEIMESVDWTGEGCSFEAAERLIQKNIDFDAMIYSQAGIMRCLLPVSKKYPGHILPSLPAGVFDYNFTGEFPTVAASVVQPIREIAGKAVDLIFTGPPLSGKHRQAMLPMRLVTKREIYKTFSDVTAVNIK